MRFRILKTELSICQLPLGAAIPVASGEFFSVTRTASEVSLVCENLPAGALRVEPGWSALEIVGPLDFALTGILASFTAPFAAAGISVFAVSTFDTDYVLVKTRLLARAVEVLSAAGHECDVE